MRDHGPTFPKTSLSPAMESALVAIDKCGTVMKERGLWRGNGAAVQFKTINALWARYLIAVSIEKHGAKTRHTARLTEIGLHVTCSLQNGARLSRFERASILTAEIIAS